MRRIAEASLVSLPTVVALSVLAIGIYAPIAQGTAGYPAGEWGYRLLFNICHQYPLRSFWLLDHPMAICARCPGGYLGVVLGIIVVLSNYNWLRPKRVHLVKLGLCSFTLGVGDAILKIWTGVDSSNVWRLFTGLAGGFGTAFLMICLVSTAVDMVIGSKLSLRREQ